MAKRARRTKGSGIEEQIKERVQSTPQKNAFEGNMEMMISTGSTLLDLAISGGRKRGGGVPGGIMVVAFGPSGCGKTVLACEIAGSIQRQGGAVHFRDPESRLNRSFAELFDLEWDEIDHDQPNTIKEAFVPLYHWEVNDPDVVNGYCVDSLAALSTSIEMDNDDGDKMGMRRAKEFSEQLRKCARKIKNGNILLFCTNQVRENADAGAYAKKTVSPGGKALKFYSSLQLEFKNPKKIKDEVTIKGKKVERVVGVEVQIEVEKSSVWKPHRSAPLTIMFDYGIDDVRENLKFVKRYTGATVFAVNGRTLSNGLDRSIFIVEEEWLENELREQVIDLWMEIEEKFESNRKKKKR